MMSRARTYDHQPKTPGDIGRYQETVIKEQGPTAGVFAGESNGTDQVQPTRVVPPLEPTKAPSAFVQWIKEEWWKGLIGAGVVGLIGFGFTNLYSLNREVGELGRDVTNAVSNAEQFRQDVRDNVERLENEINELAADLRRLEGRVGRE